MCGRYALTSPPDLVAALFKLATIPNLVPRFNIAPTQDAPIVRFNSAGERVLDEYRWGLVPFWAKDLSVGARMINARAETVSSKPAFRESFEQRRCVVPMDGFFEWRKLASGKQPHFIRRADLEPAGCAGLWASWRSPEGARVRTYTIITTTPNERVAPLHDRMPVILDRDEIDTWLDPRTAVDDLENMLDAFPAEEIDVYPVSRRVNNVDNDDEACLTPARDESEDDKTLWG